MGKYQQPPSSQQHQQGGTPALASAPQPMALFHHDPATYSHVTDDGPPATGGGQSACPEEINSATVGARPASTASSSSTFGTASTNTNAITAYAASECQASEC